MMPKLFLLAGGLATRMKPITNVVPKSMLDINGEPFIAHQLRLLQREGITRVVVCVGYLGKQIVNYLDSIEHFGLKIEYSFDGDVLLGTGGALLKAVDDYLDEDSFFVMYGDSYLDISYFEVLQSYESQSKKALMTVMKNENNWDRSNINYKNGMILDYNKNYVEKDYHYIDYGLSILKKDLLTSFQRGIKFDLADIYQKVIKEKNMMGFLVNKRFFEIGSTKGLEDMRDYLQNQVKGDVKDDS